MNRTYPGNAIEEIIENRQRIAMMPVSSKAELSTWVQAMRKESRAIRQRAMELREELARMKAEEVSVHGYMV